MKKLFIVIFLTSIVSAQKITNNNKDTLNFNLDEIVVSANRWKQTINKTSQKILHIKNKEISLQNPQTTADLLSISGKIYMQKSQLGGGSPIIRGFATNRLLYSVDGIRMNTAIFRSGNIQNIISLDPFSISSTEVLFGANSVIYGSDAIGGVMSFQTLKPQFSFTDKSVVFGKSIARYSTANHEKTAHFDINIGWKKLALITSISTFFYDDLHQGSYGLTDYIKKYNVKNYPDGTSKVILNKNPKIQSPSGYSQYNLMQKIAFQPNENINFIFGFHYSKISKYGRFDRHLRLKNGLPRYAEWDYGGQKWLMTNLEIDHKKSNLFYNQFTTRLAFQQFKESRIVRNFGEINRETNTENVNAYSLNFDFKKDIFDENSLYYGFEFVQNDIKSKGIAKNILNNIFWDIPSRYPQSTWLSVASYINACFDLSKKWSLQSGFRYNLFKINGLFDEITMKEYQFPYNKIEVKNGAITGSLGAVYKPNKNTIFSTNLSTGFRSPNVDDMGKVFDSSKGIVIVPNPNLKAEYVTNLDLSFTKVFSDIFKLDATIYYAYLKDALSRDDFRLNGKDSIIYKGIKSRVQALQNKSKATIYGVQFGSELKFTKLLSFTTDINFQKGVEFDLNGKKSPSRHTPPLFGNVKLSFQKNGLSMQLYTNYQAKVANKDMPKSEQQKTEIYALDDNKKPYAPAWTTLNFKVNYQLSKSVNLGAGLENITDIRYRPYLSGISASGRNFILSLQVKF